MAQTKSTQTSQSGQPRDEDGRFVEKGASDKGAKSTGDKSAKDAGGKSARGGAQGQGSKR